MVSYEKFVVFKVVVLLGVFEIPVFVVVESVVPIDVFENLDCTGQFGCLLDPVVHVLQGFATEQTGVGSVDSVLRQNAVVETDGFVPAAFPGRLFAAERV